MPPKPYICKLCKKLNKLVCEHERKEEESEDEKDIEENIPDPKPDSKNSSTKPYICKKCKKLNKLVCEDERKEDESEDEKDIEEKNPHSEENIRDPKPDSKNSCTGKSPFQTIKELCTPAWEYINQKLQDVDFFNKVPRTSRASGQTQQDPSLDNPVLPQNPIPALATHDSGGTSSASNFPPVVPNQPIDPQDIQGGLEGNQASFPSGSSAFSPYKRSGDILKNLLEKPPLADFPAEYPVLHDESKTNLDSTASNYLPSVEGGQPTYSGNYQDGYGTNQPGFSSLQSGSSTFPPQPIATGEILRNALLGKFYAPKASSSDCPIQPNLNEPRALEDGSRYPVENPGPNFPPLESDRPTFSETYQGGSEIGQPGFATGFSPLTSPQKRSSGEILRSALSGVPLTDNLSADDPVIKKPKITSALDDGGESSTPTLESFHPSSHSSFTENYEGDFQMNQPQFAGSYEGEVQIQQPPFTGNYEGDFSTYPYSPTSPLDLSTGIDPTFEESPQPAFADAEGGIPENQPGVDAPLDLSQRSLSNPDLHAPDEHSSENWCPLCQMNFETNADLEDHFNRMFYDETNYGMDHIAFYKEYRRSEFFKCPFCDMRFDSYSECHLHKVSVHPLQQIECRLCTIVFANAAFLKEHEVQFHKDILKHECLVCDGLFVSDSELSNHNCVPET